MNRLIIPLILLAAASLALSGCRRSSGGDDRKNVYQAPRTAAEAARVWRGRKIDVFDQHGDRLARLRVRKYGLQVFGADLDPLGQIREVGDAVVAERRGGAPRFTFVPARLPAAQLPVDEDADPAAPEAPKVDGYAIHKVDDAGSAPTAPVDGEPTPRTPERPPTPGELVGYLLPDSEAKGGWQLLDEDRAPVLLIAPEAKGAEDKPKEKAEGEGDGADAPGIAAAADDGPWRVTFFSPEQTGTTTWVIERKRWRGQLGVEANLIDEEGGRQLAMRTSGGKLSALAIAPALLTRLDPLMRAGLSQTLTRATSERR